VAVVVFVMGVLLVVVVVGAVVVLVVVVVVGVVVVSVVVVVAVVVLVMGVVLVVVVVVAVVVHPGHHRNLCPESAQSNPFSHYPFLFFHDYCCYKSASEDVISHV
jgi:hypothetical protein